LTALLYGCETWPLILREKPVFQSRVLERGFGAKRDEITEGVVSRTLRNKELDNFIPIIRYY
jgi:hypothetical protein